MKREQIEKLAIDNIVRIYHLMDSEEPSGFPERNIQEWRDLIQLRLGTPEGCTDIWEGINHAKTVHSVQAVYTEKFLEFLTSFLTIRIKKLCSCDFRAKEVANSKIYDTIDNEEVKRLSRYLNKYKGAKTILIYELYESYKEKYPDSYHDELVKLISSALSQEVEIIEPTSFTPKDYRVQTKYLEENIWVFIPALPQIIVKLKC